MQVKVILPNGTKSHTTPAKARKLLKLNKAKIESYKPFIIKYYKGEEMNLIYVEGQTIVNLDHVCHIELNEKNAKIMFFFTSMTARDNWNFNSPKEAKKIYEQLIKELNVKHIK